MDSANDTQATEDAEGAADVNREREGIICWRFSQLLALGIDVSDAESLAETDADLGLMRRLVGQGCPPAIAARIARP